jgi:hypothetical protein
MSVTRSPEIHVHFHNHNIASGDPPTDDRSTRDANPLRVETQVCACLCLGFSRALTQIVATLVCVCVCGRMHADSDQCRTHFFSWQPSITIEPCALSPALYSHTHTLSLTHTHTHINTHTHTHLKQQLQPYAAVIPPNAFDTVKDVRTM